MFFRPEEGAPPDVSEPVPRVQLMPLCCSSPSLSRAAGRPSQTVSNISWLHLPFFSFTGMQKRYTFSRNCTLNFEFGSFPDLETCDTSPSVLLGSGGHSCQPGDHEGNSQHTWNHPVSIQPCCFSLAGQHFINCTRYFNT